MLLLCIKSKPLTIFVYFRVESNIPLQDMDDTTILSELEAQGEEVMRQWTSLLSTRQTLQRTSNSNTINNNVNGGLVTNNNEPANELGCVLKTYILLLTFNCFSTNCG